MSNVISEKLESSRSFNNKVELAPGQFFWLKLHWHSDVSLATRQKVFDDTVKYLKSALAQDPALKPEDIFRLRADGIFDHSERPAPLSRAVKKTTEVFWKKTSSTLEKGRVPVNIPDVEQVDKREPYIREAGKAIVLFENASERHYLDGISYPVKERQPNETEADFIRRCTRESVEAAGDKFDPKKKKIKESLVGVALSLPKRSNYRMTILPQGELYAFFRKLKFTSTEVLAKNGIAPGAISASMNNYADHVNLLRSVESEDGSVDCLSGRAQDLETAKELAEFAFLSQMNLFQNLDKRHLAQGIVKKGDEYEFRFGAQSLLPMCFKGYFGGEEIKMVYNEIEAYRKLEEFTREAPMTIVDPVDRTKYQVRFLPLPIAACQFNSFTRVEAVLPQALSGESDAREQSDQADRALFAIAQKKMGRLDYDYGPERTLSTLILDTIHFLKNKETLKPWQEIMTRAFLMHLVQIPLVVHCKHSVDRTNVVNAMVSAMKQWLRSGKEIPKIDGKFAIFALPEASYLSSEKETVYPFKELFAFNLHKGLKITELARGDKGYRYHRGFKQHPALADLLPERYLKPEKPPGIFKRWVVPIAATFLPPLLLQILTTVGLYLTGSSTEIKKVWLPQRTLWKKGNMGKAKAVAASVLALIPIQLLLWPLAFLSSFRTFSPRKIGETALMPAKFVKNADKLFPEKTLNEDYDLIRTRQFLEA